MEVSNNLSYNKYLIELMSNNILKQEFQNNLNINLYLTLLSLNNSNYKESIYLDEINIIEDFLRKINNLKVKIQLKRKNTEINELLETIKNIYQDNTKLISKYNKDNINIVNELESKEPKRITSILDNLTKEKIKKVSNKEYYDKVRKDINENIFKNEYTIDNDNLLFNNTVISINEFYEIFSYLLDINNYKDIYPNKDENKLHKQLITKIIDIIESNSSLDNEIIPIILTNLLSKSIPNYEYINTANFNIDNIKITDLYSFANNTNQEINNNTAKWQKILIPNEYLYNKIKEIVSKGMYYFKEDNFIIENIENTTSDFKISISINNIKTFLKDNLEKLTTN